MVFSSQGGSNVLVLGPIELAPGESEGFSGSYVVVASFAPETATVRATGMDTCQARTVAAEANCSGPLAGLRISSVATANGVATISWLSKPGVVYRVQGQDDSKAPWTDLPGDVTASGDTASKEDPTVSKAQRFYRVKLIQE